MLDPRTSSHLCPSSPARAADQLHNQIQDYRQLVNQLARRYSGCNGAELEDLRQVGYLGLLRALKLAKPAEPIRLRVFLQRHIRGAILHYLRDSAATVRVPQRLRSRQVDAAAQAAHAKRLWQLRPGSLDAFPGEVIAAPGDGDCYQQLQQQERSNAVRRAFAKLPERQRRWLVEVVVQGRSLRQVAAAEHTSAMTVHRQLRRSFGEMRKELQPIINWG
jgi:RNA polymerase sigma-B factor